MNTFTFYVRTYSWFEVMLRYILILILLTSTHVRPARPYSLNPKEPTNYDFPFVKREEWHARSPKHVTPLKTPVPFVVIHHTSTVPLCYDREACCDSMRQIQDYHMDEKDWWDIGYNFGVGSDGAVYEGRGWDLLGAQSLHFNDVSIGVTCIGNWTLEVPPERQLNTLKTLLQAGVDLGYVEPNYKLFGHQDIRDTQCPGDALYGEFRRALVAANVRGIGGMQSDDYARSGLLCEFNKCLLKNQKNKAKTSDDEICTLERANCHSPDTNLVYVATNPAWIPERNMKRG